MGSWQWRQRLARQQVRPLVAIQPRDAVEQLRGQTAVQHGNRNGHTKTDSGFAASVGAPIIFTLSCLNQSPASPLVGPQTWKLWLSLAGLLAAGLGLYMPSLLGGALGAAPALLSVVSVVAGLGVFIAAWTSLRCPGCRLSLVGHALSNQSHTAWLAWLITVQECPRCQYSQPKGRQENAT
jgi:hypothetical protein